MFSLGEIWDECYYSIQYTVGKYFKGHEKEDIIQDMVIHLNDKLSRYNERDNTSIKAWVTRVVNNKCIDILRTQKRKSLDKIVSKEGNNDITDLISNDSDSTSSYQSIGSEVKIISIEDIFMSVNERDRQILILKLIKNRSVKDIDAILSITNSAVYYKRAVESIRKKFGVDALKNIYDKLDLQGNLDEM